MLVSRNQGAHVEIQFLGLSIPTVFSVTELWSQEHWLILGPRHHCGTLSQWGFLEVKGKWNLGSNPTLNGPCRCEKTYCSYFLSRTCKTESPGKLTGIREPLLAWDFFKALQLKQRINWSIMSKYGIHCLQSPKKFCREEQAETWLQASSQPSSLLEQTLFLGMDLLSLHAMILLPPSSTDLLFTVIVSHPTLSWTKNFFYKKKKKKAKQ